MRMICEITNTKTARVSTSLVKHAGVRRKYFLFGLAWIPSFAAHAQFDFSRYMPIAAANRWVFICTDQQFGISFHEGLETYTTTANSADGFTLNRSSNGPCFTSKDDYIFDSSAVRLVKSVGSDADSTVITFNPPLVAIPNNSNVGATTDSSGNVTLSATSIGTISGTYTSHAEVLGSETLSTPAGTFATIKTLTNFEEIFNIPGSPTVKHQAQMLRWFVDGVGIVKYVQNNWNSGTPTDTVTENIISSNLIATSDAKDDGDSEDDCKYCGDPLNYITGNSFQVEADFVGSKRGAQLRRYYNSRSALPGQMGGNWTNDYDKRLYFDSLSSPRKITLKREDGKILSFMEAADRFAFWICDADSKFQLKGIYDSASSTIPDEWLLRTKDNIYEVYDANVGILQKVAYARGGWLQLTLDPSQSRVDAVTDHFGRAQSFLYDGASQLLQSVTFNGLNAVSYEYDAQNNLSKAVYPDQSTKTYRYNEGSRVGTSLPHALTSVLDESGSEKVSWSFDALGRATSSQLANGADKTTISYPNSAGSVVLTDSLGKQRTVTYGKVQGVGHPTSMSAASMTPTIRGYSASTYDVNGNAASRDTFAGNRTCSVFDLKTNLVLTRVQGLPNTASCGTYTALNAVLLEGARKTSTSWHPLWRLATQVAEPGRITTSVYNGQPDPFNGGATASCAPSTALLPDNSPIAVLCKRVEQATTDVDGHLGFTASLQPGVVNRVSSWTYNQYGQVLTSVDPLMNTTTSTYWGDTSFTGADPNAVGHTVGDLKTVTNAANKVTLYDKYDRNGNLLQSTDTNSVVTLNTYDARQRLTSTSVGGQLTGYAYWPTGLLKRVTQPDASFVAYGYDDAHRLTSITDNLGNTITYTLDNMGNRTAEVTKDSSNNPKRSLTRSMDALSRVQQTTGIQ